MNKRKYLLLINLIILIIISIIICGNIGYVTAVTTEQETKYFISGEYVKGILPDTSKEELIEQLDKQYENISINDEKIVTSGKIIINEHEYTLIVVGDVNGDGKLTALDLNKIKGHLLENKQDMLEGDFLMAADVDGNERILASDLNKIKDYILGKEIKFFMQEFKWDENCDYKIDTILSTTLNYKVNCKDEIGNELDDVTWEVTGGTITNINGLETNWTLPNEEGEFKITATSPFGNKLTSKVYVLKNNELGTQETKEYDLDEDTDGDGLTNEEEYNLGTNIEQLDTDMDGLSDGYEVNISKTDPLNADTDGDGILDGNEILLSLNPLKTDTNDDGIPDSEETTQYNYTNSENKVEINITGKGNISDVSVGTVEMSNVTNIPGVLGNVYQFYTTGDIENATVEIEYDVEKLEEKELSEENLSLYYFNSDNLTFEKQNSTVDTQNKKVTTELEHFSMYVLADSTKMITGLKNEIIFLIDNSGSMYTPEQAAEKNTEGKTAEDYSHFEGNDSEYKRLDLAEKLINKLNGDYKFGVAKFTATYTKLSDLTNKKEQALNAINSIRTEKETFDGTYIGEALLNSLSMFNNSTELTSKYVILISDGGDTSYFGNWDKSSAISKAKKLNVKVITIGLTNGADEDYLRDISEQTGGKYFYANDANALTEIYNILYSEINNNLIDTDGDGENDGIIIADSGFVPSVNGLNINNYRARSDGNCYGIATFSRLYYMNKLPLTASKTGTWDNEQVDVSYNIENGFFRNNTPLYEYKMENSLIQQMLTDSYKDIEQFKKDFENGIKPLRYRIKSDYRKIIDENPNMFNVIEKTNNSEKYGEYINEYIYINLNNGEGIDAQLFKAIDYYFIQQKEDKFSAITTKSGLKELKEKLSNNSPEVICFEAGQPSSELLYEYRVLLNNGLNHAVNAIKLIQDIENPNMYKIEVYDNNYSGVSKYIEVKTVQFDGIVEKIGYDIAYNFFGKDGYDGTDDSYSRCYFKTHYGNESVLYITNQD